MHYIGGSHVMGVVVWASLNLETSNPSYTAPVHLPRINEVEGGVLHMYSPTIWTIFIHIIYILIHLGWMDG